MGPRPGNCPGAIYRIRGIIEAMPLGRKIVEVGKVTEPRPGDRQLGPKSVEIRKGSRPGNCPGAIYGVRGVPLGTASAPVENSNSSKFPK